MNIVLFDGICLSLDKNIYKKIDDIFYFPFTTEPRYQQNYVTNILITNALLLLVKEPSAAIIVSDVNYALSLLNSSKTRTIIWCRFYCAYFETSSTDCRKSNDENTVVTI